MEFTLEQRREIYQKAYEIHLEDINWSKERNCGLNGMCSDLRESILKLHDKYIKFIEYKETLPEFYKLKTSDYYDHYDFWWNKYDYEIRKKMYEDHLINI